MNEPQRVVDEQQLFCSMSSYVAGRMMGRERGTKYIWDLLRNPDTPDAKNLFPAVRSIWHLQQLATLQMSIDCGATNIAKSLSRHFHKAYNSNCEAWIHFDDDGETTAETLAWLLAAVEYDKPGAPAAICSAPYIHRGADMAADVLVLIEWSPIHAVRDLHCVKYPGGKARAAKRTGFGTVVVNRAAMRALVNAWEGPLWLDDDGEHKVPLFHQMMETVLGADPHIKWHGPDFSFFHRVPQGVRVEALVTGATMHVGYALDLGDLQNT